MASLQRRPCCPAASVKHLYSPGIEDKLQKVTLKDLCWVWANETIASRTTVMKDQPLTGETVRRRRYVNA